jgi:hypothetical protein
MWKKWSFYCGIEVSKRVRWDRFMRQCTKELLCFLPPAAVTFRHKTVLRIFIKLILFHCTIQIWDHVINNSLERPSPVVTSGFPLFYQSLIRKLHPNIASSPSGLEYQLGLDEFISFLPCGQAKT